MRSKTKSNRSHKLFNSKNLSSSGLKTTGSWESSIDIYTLLLLNHFSRVPIDGSPPGSPVPGILQARTLGWVAISFSNAWKWKAKVKSLRCGESAVAQLCPTLRDPMDLQAPPSIGFSGQEYWSGLPLPSPKDRLESSNLPFSIQWKNLKNKDPLPKKLIMFYGEATSWILVTKDRVI